MRCRSTTRRGRSTRTDPTARRAAGRRDATDHVLRYLAGLDAERARLDIKTMALEAHEPLWSMGDDTPTPGRGRLDRPVADHLRQAFAQVTNPAIDPERERVVMDLRVELGRRPALLGGPPRGPRTVRLARPIVVDLDGLVAAVRGDGATVRTLDATWDPADGAAGLAAALDAPRHRGRRRRPGAASRSSLVSDAGWSVDRLPIPSILAVGAVHTALTAAGLRGRTDLVVEAADVLDVHAMAMVLAVGATAVHPRLAIELAAELAGTRGAEDRHRGRGGHRTSSPPSRPACARPSPGWASAPSRRTSAGRWSTSSTSMPTVVARCFPMAAAWPGRTTLADLADRQLRRRAAALALPEPAAGREPRLPDPGFARFRADGEAHLFSPPIAGEIQVLSGHGDPDRHRRRARHRRGPGALPRGARPPAADALPSRATSCASARAATPLAARRRRAAPATSSAASSSRR